jgi:hypothetical protein
MACSNRRTLTGFRKRLAETELLSKQRMQPLDTNDSIIMLRVNSDYTHVMTETTRTNEVKYILRSFTIIAKKGSLYILCSRTKSHRPSPRISHHRSESVS